MATYNVATAKHATLVAATVDTVNLSNDSIAVEVLNRNGSAEIYFTVDGSTPTVGGDNCYVLPAAVGSVIVPSLGADVVKLISAGAPTYSVQAAK